MAMAERQSAHRERLEFLVVNSNVANQTRGSWFGFILGLVCIVGGFILIFVGKSIVGLSAIIASVAGLASIFVYAKREQRKERIEKATVLQSRQSR
jgi:uncharacterized membrane protein